MRRLSTIIILLALVAGVRAQTTCDSAVVLRPIASMFMAEVGHASLLDSYLTPVTYGGINVGLSFTATRATGFAPERWVRQWGFGADFSNVENQVGNNDMQSLMAEAQWSMMRRWRDVWQPGLQLMVGGMARLRGGVIYNAANSNNVVSVKAHVALGLTGMAVYHTRLWRLPVTLAYQPTLPVAGVFFSPDYDESYYEMYLGNHGGLAHFGWWGNRFDMTNLVAADLHLGGTILRLGYRNRFERSWVSNLNTHITTHTLVVGLGGDFLSVPRKTVTTPARIISSIY
ncbi:MAG: DUF3316 domain-containing protein [Muribaculaceae bacterium]|nr:DUF3316 domain-containing protein [Muribaculaceae bacterium]